MENFCVKKFQLQSSFRKFDTRQKLTVFFTRVYFRLFHCSDYPSLECILFSKSNFPSSVFFSTVDFSDYSTVLTILLLNCVCFSMSSAFLFSVYFYTETLRYQVTKTQLILRNLIVVTSK